MKKTSIFEPIKRTSLRHELVKNILIKIFKGELSGGNRLVERDLAEQLGVSRTPIREALAELASIGMVQVKPNHGVEVKPFTKVQLKNIYQVRQILESHATRMACDYIDTTTLQEIRREIHALLEVKHRGPDWSGEALLLDQKFHNLICDKCGNERLVEDIERYRNLVQALRMSARHQTSSQAKALESHLAIIDALLTGDASLAAAKMEEHINQAAEDALATIFAT